MDTATANLEDVFRNWAKPPSDTEQEKATNAVNAIRGAISNNDKLSSLSIDVFPQGSYRANTNVRNDSDVDICVCLRSTFYYDLPTKPPNRPEDYGITPGSGMDFSDFKNLVETALVSRFGRSSVKRGNKAFDIHESTYRLDADVLASFEYRRYTGIDVYGNQNYHGGIKFIGDDRNPIINWPEQNYSNGVTKNSNTSYRYKAMIRILKRLRNDMQEKNITEARNIASSLIESLVWNVPNEGFGHDEYSADVRYVLEHIFNETRDDARCNEWGEVNELKYLFRATQPWTRVQANSFLHAAWNHLGFE